MKDTDLVWIKNIYIHRNAFPGEKDYGVPVDHIDDTFMKLKKNQILRRKRKCQNYHGKT
jgi:hypothetical protein